MSRVPTPLTPYRTATGWWFFEQTEHSGPGAKRSISATYVRDPPRSGVSRSTSPLDWDESVEWEVPGSLLLLLEKAEIEDTGVTIPYVHPKSLLVFRRPSSYCVFSGSLANHWSSQRAQVQLANLKTLYQQQSLRRVFRTY